jgi:putative selenate reductase
VEVDFFPEEDLRSDSDTLETQLPNVFAGGDAVRGASTLIKAIADGKRVAETITRRAALEFDLPVNITGRCPDPKTLQIEQARRVFGPQVREIPLDQRFDFDLVVCTLGEESARQEARRCLQCDVLCNICTTVCPNRANIAYPIEPIEIRVQQILGTGEKVRIEEVEIVRITQKFQIINIGDFCNECGNCSTFCPTSGAPYRVKPKFYLSQNSFENEQNGYMFVEGVLKARVDGASQKLSRYTDHLIYETSDIRARLNLKTFAAEEATFLSDTDGPIVLRHAAQMAVMFTALKDLYLFG